MPAIDYDVLIAGGGPAGLAGAVALARSRRRVLLVDAGAPRNAPADGAHNVLGQEGIAPAELIAKGRAEAAGYGAELRDGRVASARRAGDGFALELDDGTTVTARRLLLATGLVDELPDVPGLAGGWGSDVLHCPYCHGWEVRDQHVGILGRGPASIHQALLFRQLSERVTVFRGDMDDPGEEAWAQLAAIGVRVVEGALAHIARSDGSLEAVVLADGSAHPVDVLVVAPRFVARTDLFVQLGGVPTEHPMGRFIDAEAGGRTAVPGVWSAGNSADMTAMVVASAAAGVQAGAHLNADLAAEDAAAAVAARATG